MQCADNDFMFPMQAEIFYPDVAQSAYGNVKKAWMMDRKVACNLNYAGTAFKEEIRPNIDITLSALLMGRFKKDIRTSSLGQSYALTNILISNITDKDGVELYVETSGPRAGKSTLFEIATFQPFSGPFGHIEYYKIVLRRSENQGVAV